MNIKREYIYIISIVIGIIIFLDQFRIHGQFYEFLDINNHETIGLSFLMFGLGGYSMRSL